MTELQNQSPTSKSELSKSEQAKSNQADVAVFLGQTLIGLNYSLDRLSPERIYQEIFLLERVLTDENSNSLIVCLAIQNASYLIEALLNESQKNENFEIASLIRNLKKLTKKAVGLRNRKFFSGDRAAVKSFDRYLDKIITEHRLKISFLNILANFMRPSVKTNQIKVSQVSTEIHDLRLIKTYGELEAKLEGIFLNALDLDNNFRKVLLANLNRHIQNLGFRHYIELALQSTNTTKDGVLHRETKLVKLLLDETILIKKNQSPQPIAGMVEFNSHVAR